MASPQVENGYFKISTELWKALYKIRINGESRQMLDVIIHKTYGYHKKTDKISTSQFMQLTGLGRTAIYKARKKLLGMNLISVTQKGDSNIKCYCIQKDYEKWLVSPKKVMSPKKVHGVTQKGDKSVTQKGTHTIIENNTIQKDILGKPKGVTQKGDSKKSNPEIKIFIDYAATTYKTKFNNPLFIDGGKDGQLIKKLLSTFSLTNLQRLWVNFLETEDDFIKNAGFSIAIFKTQINKLVSGNNGNKTETPDYSNMP